MKKKKPKKKWYVKNPKKNPKKFATKEVRKERLRKFREEVLPGLLELYDVEVHGPKNAPATMYKIVVNFNKSYDFYPQAEKMRINVGDFYEWRDMTVEEIEGRLRSILPSERLS